MLHFVDKTGQLDCFADHNSPPAPKKNVMKHGGLPKYFDVFCLSPHFYSLLLSSSGLWHAAYWMQNWLTATMSTCGLGSGIQELQQSQLPHSKSGPQELTKPVHRDRCVLTSRHFSELFGK